MRLNLYNSAMERISIIGGKYLSVMWSEGYNTVEPFTLEIIETEEYRTKIRPECYVGRDDRKTLMVIKTVEFKNGKIIASGKQATRCLDDVPFLGTIPKDLMVLESIRSAYAGTDGYPMFRVSESGPDDTYGHQISNKSILELTETMCQSTDMGFRAVRRGGYVNVELYKPQDNENLKFSEAFGNLTVDSLLLSTENLKNHAIVLGAGEDENRTRVEIDHSGGGMKLSMIVDARDLTREDNDTDESYREKLLARGEEKLQERTETWKCVFAPLAADFGRKYDLGDVLTVILTGYHLKLKARVSRFTQKAQRNKITTTIEVGKITIVR